MRGLRVCLNCVLPSKKGFGVWRAVAVRARNARDPEVLVGDRQQAPAEVARARTSPRARSEISLEL